MVRPPVCVLDGGMYRFTTLLGLLLVGACAASQPQAAEPTAAASSAAAPTAADIQGFWAQYWAREGEAETQRYVFLQDGRFGWLAPQRDVPPQDPLQRSGTYVVDGQGLTLHVTRERFAPCTGGCADAGQPRIVEHATPMTMTFELGECPPNDEAAQLDASYQCRSIGGHAFWRRAAPDAQDSAPYFQ